MSSIFYSHNGHRASFQCQDKVDSPQSTQRVGGLSDKVDSFERLKLQSLKYEPGFILLRRNLYFIKCPYLHCTVCGSVRADIRAVWRTCSLNTCQAMQKFLDDSELHPFKIRCLCKKNQPIGVRKNMQSFRMSYRVKLGYYVFLNLPFLLSFYRICHMGLR